MSEKKIHTLCYGGSNWIDVDGLFDFVVCGGHHVDTDAPEKMPPSPQRRNYDHSCAWIVPWNGFGGKNGRIQRGSRRVCDGFNFVGNS